MSGLLLSQETVATVVELVVSSAAEVIADAAGVGVSLVDDTGRRTTAAASDPVVERLDQVQYDLDEGPCLQASADGVAYRIDDMVTEERWPRWTAVAARSGMRAAMSVPLVVGDRCLGAIKVYATEPGVLGDREEHLLGLFAEQAAVLMANVKALGEARRFSERLTAALRDRDAVNTAKGVLMEREHVDADTAFARLVSLSERDAKPLHDVAWTVLSSRGDLRERGAEGVD
jgi:GAF domain-containing protein